MSQRTKALNLMHDTANANYSLRHWVTHVKTLREKGQTDTEILDKLTASVDRSVTNNQKALDSYYIYLQEEKII